MKFINRIAVAMLVIFALLTVVTPPSAAATRTDIKSIIIDEARNSDVPPALALAIAKVESDFNKDALSTAGARGVMQIMPKTAKDEFGIDADELWNARLNIQLGIDFLSRLYDQYDGSWEMALSHYNGGTLDKRGRRAVAHSYTKAYVESVLRWRQRYEDQSTVWRIASNDQVDDRDDGWTPARTKVRKKFRKKRRKQRYAKLNDGWNRSSKRSRRGYLRGYGRGYARRGASGKSWISTSWDGRLERYDDDESSFDDRRRRARDSLDDFGPGTRWRKS